MLVFVEGRARALALVERGVAGPAVAVTGDVAAPVLPGRRRAALIVFHHLGALLVALAARELHALLVDRRGVAERHVIGVEHVLDLELPVAVVGVAVHAGVEGKRAVRRAVDEVVDVAFHRADVVLEARSGRREAREHEAAVFADARHARQAELLLLEIGRAAFRHRHADERAVGVERPAVIEAGEPRGMAAALVRDLGAAVGAAVEQHAHAAVVVARHDHGLAAEIGGDEVARVRHLAGVADEQPGAAEDPFHLQFEQVGIGIDPPVHAPGLDQPADFVLRAVQHGRPSLRCVACDRNSRIRAAGRQGKARG